MRYCGFGMPVGNGISRCGNRVTIQARSGTIKTGDAAKKGPDTLNCEKCIRPLFAQLYEASEVQVPLIDRQKAVIGLVKISTSPMAANGSGGYLRIICSSVN